MKGVSTSVQAEVQGQPWYLVQEVFIPPEPFRMLPFKTGSPIESEVELNSMGWAMSPPSHPPQMLRLPSHYFWLSVGTKDTYHIFMFSQQGLYRQRHFLRPCFVFKA